MLTRTNNTEEVKIDFNLFTPEEYSEIHLFLETELHRFETKINKEVWDDRLYQDTQGILEMTLIKDEEFISLIANRLIERFNSNKDISKYNVLYYRSQGIYNINWHDDGSYNAAACVYLNEKWHRDLGGYFIYQMSNEQTMTAVQPVQGTAVYQKGGVLHATTPVSTVAPSRKSLQVFIYE